MKNAIMFAASLLLTTSVVQVAAHEGDSDYVFLSVKSGIARSFFAGSIADAVFPILDPQPEGSSVAFYCMRDRDLLVISFNIEFSVSHGVIDVYDQESGRKLNFTGPFVADFEKDMMVVTVDTTSSIAPLLRDLRAGETYTFRLTQTLTSQSAQIDVSFPPGRIMEYDLETIYSACEVQRKYR